MLIDTGFPGNGDRDINRILTTMKQAGVLRLDYLLVTHYHLDHVGNAAALAAKVPVGTFVDHGETVETNSKALFDTYVAARKSGKHLQVKPGDKVPIAGADVTVVSAVGEHLARPLAGAGAENPLCASFQPKEADPSENAQSVGTVFVFGRFRMIDLGDLTNARGTCSIGSVAISTLYPASRAPASVRPTEATCGIVKVTFGTAERSSSR